MTNIRLAAAAESLSTQWIPVSPQIQDVIVTKFRKGHYNTDPTILVQDLTKDLSLFGYCLRRLYALAKQGKIKLTSFDIVQMFKQVDSATLHDILSEKPANISFHKLEDADPQQVGCIHQMLVAAVTTETICEKAHFPKCFGFATAYLRLLGLTLIASNYPHIMKQALQAKNNEKSLDHALMKLLGYSPKSLALAVAHNWGVSPEIEFALGAAVTFNNLSEQAQIKMQSAASTLKKSCEVGEILARISHPEMYPTSQGEWSEAKKRIEIALGPQGLKLIQQQVQSACRAYVSEKQNCFASLNTMPIGPDVAENAVQQAQPAIFNEDSEFINKLKNKYEKLYLNIGNSSLRKENMLIWSQELVPAAGFSGGCIFMFDFDTSELIPRYRFGACSLSVAHIKFSTIEKTEHPAAEAFKSTQLLLEINPWGDNEKVGYVVQTFGVIQRVGVLYLEASKQLAGMGQEPVIEIFGRVKKALQDCLGVK